MGPGALGGPGEPGEALRSGRKDLHSQVALLDVDRTRYKMVPTCTNTCS